MNDNTVVTDLQTIVAFTARVIEANTKAKIALDAVNAIERSVFLTEDEKRVLDEAQKIIYDLRRRTSQHEINEWVKTGKFNGE